jgi:RNA recognition motif-containing protein
MQAARVRTPCPLPVIIILLQAHYDFGTTTKTSTEYSAKCHVRTKFVKLKVYSQGFRLYIKNLPDKLRKPDLRRELYMLFSAYGVIIDVNAQKNVKMRGQAHVTFKDIASSTQAMRALQGFEFFGKQMVSE